MTTIIYDHEKREIAFDSRITRGSTICSDDYCKKHQKNNVVFITAGYEAEVQRFISDYPNLEGAYDCDGAMVENGKVYSFGFQDGRFLRLQLNFSEAWGSGQDHALTALDLGKSAKEAVKYAMKRDCGTGGKIRVMKV